jgi:hypothetical protein
MVGLAFLGRIVLTGDRAKALALDSTLWVAIGLGAALGVPAILCLARTLGRADGNVLAVASNTAPPIAHLGLFLCASAALVALGALGPRGEEGAGRARTLELWGTLAFLGVVGTLSLAYVATDVLYASILFIGGAALVLVGLARRRAFMVSSATLTLLALVFVQYFAKLHDKVPWGLLALGFGLSLLALAILFERKVKPFLPELRRWS